MTISSQAGRVNRKKAWKQSRTKGYWMKQWTMIEAIPATQTGPSDRLKAALQPGNPFPPRWSDDFSRSLRLPPRTA